MTSAVFELQKAVYTVLKDDTTLQGLLGGAGKVFQHVPQGTNYPFVVVEIGDISTMNAVLLRAWNIQLRVMSMVREQGNKSCLEIQDRIITLLHNASLTLGSNMHLVFIKEKSSSVSMQFDGKTYRGTATFNTLVQDLSVG